MKTLFIFCTALVPGAGQMYLGYMKRGICLLTAFFGVIAVASLITLEPILFALPIIWAFSFFDTFNIARQTPEQKAANPDKLLFDVKLNDTSRNDLNNFLAKRHKWFGAGLIIVGLSALYNAFILPLAWRLYEIYPSPAIKWFINDFMYNIPTLIVAVLLLVLGVNMLKKAGTKIQKEDEIVEFSIGDKNEH